MEDDIMSEKKFKIIGIEKFGRIPTNFKKFDPNDRFKPTVISKFKNLKKK